MQPTIVVHDLVSLSQYHSHSGTWLLDGLAAWCNRVDSVAIAVSVESRCRLRICPWRHGWGLAHLLCQHVMQPTQCLKLHHRQLVCLFGEVFALVFGNLLLLHGRRDSIDFGAEALSGHIHCFFVFSQKVGRSLRYWWLNCQNIR